MEQYQSIDVYRSRIMKDSIDQLEYTRNIMCAAFFGWYEDKQPLAMEKVAPYIRTLNEVIEQKYEEKADE